MGKYFVTHGEEVSGFYSRTVNSAKEAAKFCNTKYFSELDSLIEVSDTLFITVTDGAIKEIWDCIAAKDVKGKSVCHFSGSLSKFNRGNFYRRGRRTGSCGYLSDV